MAQFVLGDQDIAKDISPRENDNCENDNGDSETGQGGIEGDKRHYKKDSRYMVDKSYYLFMFELCPCITFIKVFGRFVYTDL